MAKLAIILTLAIFLTRHQERIHEPKTLFKSLLLILLPVVLIYKQPDLGTTLVIIASWFGMVYIAGAKIKHLIALVMAGLLLFCTLWFSGKLNDFQKRRILDFVFPQRDVKGSGYHVAQARIAIGSGQMWGKGLFQSTQVRGGYIPEKQTDFIFTTIGEELGFVGSVAVVLLFAGLFLRGVMIMAAADEDPLGKLIAAGIVTMLAFHTIENIGMNVGVMPVAGVPLPFISSGGTNLFLNLTCIGLLQSISLNRHQLLFR
jgi:rod shape determining protein RodA